MYSPKTLIAAAAAIGLVQMCPAPPAVVAAVAGGAVSGAIAGGAAICTKYCPGGNKREVRVNSAKFFLAARDLPPGVSQESIDQCTGQLNDQKNAGGVVTISDVDESSKSLPLPAFFPIPPCPPLMSLHPICSSN